MQEGENHLARIECSGFAACVWQVRHLAYMKGFPEGHFIVREDGSLAGNSSREVTEPHFTPTPGEVLLPQCCTQGNRSPLRATVGLSKT